MLKYLNETEMVTCYNYTCFGTVSSTYEATMRYTYIIGTAEEIKPVYKSMKKAWENDRLSIAPVFLNFEMFNDDKYYGIEISWNGMEPYDQGINYDATFMIVNEHKLLGILLRSL